jgi:hypothetical protein
MASSSQMAAARGHVMILDTKAGSIDIVVASLRTLAGVEIVGDKVWVSQFYNTFTHDLTSGEIKVQLVGNDGGKCDVWLVDNLDIFYESLILTSGWGVPPSESVVSGIAQSTCISTAARLAVRSASAEAEDEDLATALLQGPRRSRAFLQYICSSRSCP